jgi:hypothetical protein
MDPDPGGPKTYTVDPQQYQKPSMGDIGQRVANTHTSPPKNIYKKNINLNL